MYWERGEVGREKSDHTSADLWSNLHKFQYVLPLCVCGVRAGGVVSTHVEEDDRMFRSPSQVLQQSPYIHPTIGLVPVAIPADVCEPCCFEYWDVVS